VTIMVDVSTTSPRRVRRAAGRPWSVLAASVVGVVGAVLSLTVLGSVVGLIGSGDAATGGALLVPVGRIVVVVGLGYLIGAALLVVSWRTRSVVAAWVTALIAAGVTGIVSLYPLVATALSAVGQVGEVVPWIIGLVERVTG